MGVSFHDQIYIIDEQNSISGIIFLKEGNKLDDRNMFQKKVDRERFKKNRIDKYSDCLNQMIINKLKDYYEKQCNDSSMNKSENN